MNLNLFLFFFLLFFPCLAYSQVSNTMVTVNTNQAKLTETEKTNSKVIKILEIGHKLELIQIIFPNGIGSTSRLKVKDQENIGYVTSYFIEQTSLLKELEIAEIRRISETNRLIEDSILKEKKKQNSDYFEKLKINEEAEIRINDSIADSMLKKAKAEGKASIDQTQKESADILKEREEKFISIYGSINGKKIAKRTIWIGMTEKMLIDSWGIPEDINTTVTKYITRKQYVYGIGQYVYVQNGFVDSWQN